MNSLTPNNSHFDNWVRPAEPPVTRYPINAEPSAMYRILRRNRYAILAVFGLCLLVALVISELQTPLYRAEALIEVQGLNENFMKASEYSPNATTGRTADGFLSTQIRLLKSEAVATMVVQSTRLNENPVFFRDERQAEAAAGRVSATPGAPTRI